jgi:hypothetical protein
MVLKRFSLQSLEILYLIGDKNLLLKMNTNRSVSSEFIRLFMIKFFKVHLIFFVKVTISIERRVSVIK